MAPNLEEDAYLCFLKPLMEISKNVDIDLYSILESYINTIRIFDVNKMNFPIAAMVVQNSANIYCKKVDSLCNSTQELFDDMRRKQNDGKENEGSAKESAPVDKVDKRKKKVNRFTNSNFITLDNIASARNIDCKDEEESQPEFVTLNGAMKVKPKPNTCCNLYCGRKDEIMGKKDEFRLHWKISSCGLLTEEYSAENDRVYSLVLGDDTIIEESPAEEPIQENGIEEDQNINLQNGDTSFGGEDIPPPFEEEPSSPGVLKEERIKRLDINVVNAEEVDALLWQPVEGNNNVIPDKPLKRKKVTKVPEELQETKKENKRKWTEIMNIINRYEVIEMLAEDRYKVQDVFNFDKDLFSIEKKEQRLRRHLILKRRRNFNEMVAREAGRDYIGNFPGFHDMEPDDFDGFAGFDNDNNNNDDLEDCDNGSQVEVPLPSSELFHQNPPDALMNNSYKDEAHQKLTEYWMQKKIDQSRMTDLAKRVAAWHENIMPILEAAEERASFDIHEYGTNILEKFPHSKGKFTLPFGDIVAKERPEEVARFFLSSLMLANTYNVEITKSDPSDLALDCMNLTLLSRNRHYEELDDNMRTTSNKQH